MIRYFKKATVISAVALIMCTPVKGSDALDIKVAAMVSQMTLGEKLDMIHGDGFNMAAVEGLGLPPVNMSDASMGLRVTPWPHAKGRTPSTAFPASIMLAATWNPDTAARYATAVAEEFRGRNMHVLLGPGINLYRSPLCGRNYEYMGEDPYLISRMVVDYVKAVKNVGVIPVVKHLVANNSEIYRKESNSVVSERALREIYFPGFKAAVEEADVSSVMNAYNLLNGEYCGESSWLLKDVLRGEWGFKGFVVSDWTSIWNSELSANSGVDIEMPGGSQTKVLEPKMMRQLLDEGKVTMTEIDRKIQSLIRPCVELGVYEKDWTKPELNDLEAHAKVALDTAREGITLLKNADNLLPLRKGSDVVVIGPAAKETPTTGKGSGGVYPLNPVSVYDGLVQNFDNVQYLEQFDKDVVASADAVIVAVGYNVGFPIENFTTGKSIEDEQKEFNAKLNGDAEGEGNDRKHYGLPDSHNDIIEKCADANPNTVVTYVCGSGIAMPWINKVKGVIWMMYPGANGSIAAAEILAGKVNPSGKLPISIEKDLKDNAAYGNLGLRWGQETPYEAGVKRYANVNYEEGIFLGYRHLDIKNIEPQFCFGHGLSYTTFKYSDVKVKVSGDSAQVLFTITNTGKRDGYETAQLYVKDVQSSVPRPLKELKGFKKVFLKKGEKETVYLELDKAAFSFWHPETKEWTLEPGTFELLIGASSRDIRLNKTIEL